MKYAPARPDEHRYQQKRNISVLKQRVKTEGTAALAEQLDIGEPTLIDIVSEISKPGRDPREELPKPLLRTDVMGIIGFGMNGCIIKHIAAVWNS